MKRIKWVSQTLSLIFLLALFIKIGFYFYSHFWLLPNQHFHYLGVHMTLNGSTEFSPEKLTQALRYDGYLGLPDLILFCCVFVSLSQLFRHYAQNQFFTVKNNLLIKIIGLSLIGQFILSLLTVPALGYLMRTHTLMLINLNDLSFTKLITGLVALCIGWIFKTALTLKETQDLTI